jgi:hypothetical protein
MSGASMSPAAMSTGAGGAATGWVLRAAAYVGADGQHLRFRVAGAAAVVDMVVAGTAAEPAP